MNKKIILSICIVVVIAVIIIVASISSKDDNINNNLNDNFSGKEISFYTDGNVASEGLEPINKDIVLGDILQEVKDENINKLKGLTNTEANSLMDLDWYAGLEKKVAKYEDKNEYTEIWLLKVSDASQTANFFRMFNERIESLRYEYKNQKQISNILNNEENIIMKQQDGIAIIIISNEASNIEKSIDTMFMK